MAMASRPALVQAPPPVAVPNLVPNLFTEVRAPIQVPPVVPQTNGTIAGSVTQEQTRPFQPTHFVTLTDVQAMLKQEHSKKQLPSLPDLDVKPPYSQEILTMPYPTGYIVPKFIKFDGKQGNAREHVVRFIETLGVYGSDHFLGLREFSKSLIERAYSWYVNLAPNPIKSWEEMVNKFHMKFFQVQKKVTTLTLERDVQKESEDILDYIKRFQDKAIDCHEPIDEAHLVSICVEGAICDYKIFLVNHNLPTFLTLVEVARNLSTIGPLHRSHDNHRYSCSSRVAAVTSTRGSHSQGKASSSRKRKSYEDINPYPCCHPPKTDRA